MEFDIATFAAEVTAALQYQSPYTHPLKEPRGLDHESPAEGSSVSHFIDAEYGRDNLFTSYRADVAAALGHTPSDSENTSSPSTRECVVDAGTGAGTDAAYSRKRRRLETSSGSDGRDVLVSDEEEGGVQDAEAGNLDVEAEDESDSDEDLDDLEVFLHPDLDMTTAISRTRLIPPKMISPYQSSSPSTALTYAEPLDAVPHFYAYIVKSTLLPIRRVQHELVSLYFQHIHPMFPIVDEYRISELHRKYRGHEELMSPSEFAVYHGVMVAGFAHLSEAQVRLTPYRSVLEGQEAQVDQLKARYWSQLTTDQVVLTQICLVLSLWSPGWIGTQNNSYWLDMAFKHASSSKLWESPPSASSPKTRHRLLWWCCLIRDRVLALGMRRPHRLHKASFDDHVIDESDFGLEAKYPSYLDMESKRVAMLAFIWFCKLSKIMARIAVVKGRHRFERDWNGGEQEEGIEEGLREMDGFERELRGWLDGFEGVVEDVLGMSREVEQSVPVAISTLRIIAHSLRAGLYQPYLHLASDHPALREANIDPLQRMKDGAREVAVTCREVMFSKKCDAIPTWLVAWVTLPVAVYHVNQLIRHNSTPDQVLMPFLAQLVRRTSGALMLLRTVRAATKDHIERIEAELDGDADAVRVQFIYERSGMEKGDSTRSAEAKLLACVTRVVDSALERYGSVQEE